MKLSGLQIKIPSNSRFEALILIILFITLNSCSGQTKDGLKQQIMSSKMITNDTILIFSSQYNIVTKVNSVLDIEIKDERLLQNIKSANQPIFKIEIEGSYYMIKGNDILSSSVPKECDYFYPLINTNKVFLHNNILNLRMIKKAT